MPKPWLMMIAWPAAHGLFAPAPWARDTMSDYTASSTPEYNASEGNMQQKHWLPRQLGPLSEETAAKVDKIYHRQLEALKSVNQHVKELVHRLDHQGQLDDTFILYTSNNGFQFGQHQLAIDKHHL
jgi:N-acetylglucosamine-6-sulfatase